jgi:NAD-dependent dihydropyrimidine dehydrogenase PreA subunit
VHPNVENNQLMAGATRIVFCQCAHAQVIPTDVNDDVLRRLNQSGVAFEVVPDLCELAARKDPVLQRLAESDDLRIAACFPRAVTWLFHAAGADLRSEHVDLLNMREQSAEEVSAGLIRDLADMGAPNRTGATELLNIGASDAQPTGRNLSSEPCQCSCTGGAAEEPVTLNRKLPIAQPNAWIPWFPVIDYDRCEGCKQCLGFCLFGVFAVGDNDRVEVRNPQNCKTGCPACGRVCSTVAIMFPKYGKRPINGDAVRDDDIKNDTVKVDVSLLVDGDVHARLRQRRQGTRKRFTAGPRIPTTAEERAAHLKKMQAELDIPESVIQDLSSSCGCQQASTDTDKGTSDLPPCCAPSEERSTAPTEQT